MHVLLFQREKVKSKATAEQEEQGDFKLFLTLSEITTFKVMHFRYQSLVTLD